MFIDTHAHLNFKIFKARVEEVLESSYQAGVEQVICVGTHLKSSRLAVRQAEKFGQEDGRAQLWATVGVHPHHVWDLLVKEGDLEPVLDFVVKELSQLAENERVVAIGEVGFDRHFYDQTQYEDKQITAKYMDWQRAFFIAQLEIAKCVGKAVIIHNRESVDDLLGVFEDRPELIQPGKMVLHCCEPEERLLEFAKKHKLYIGVDGDVTYDESKQEYISQVPLEMLVLETDSPFMVPEPDRSKFNALRSSMPFKERACQPKHVADIAKQVAGLHKVSPDLVAEVTTKNAKNLFRRKSSIE
jgi:TatD DNase family protein